MKLRAILTSLAALTLAASPALADQSQPLLAGQHTDIGEVLVCDDGSDIFVTYDSTGALLSTTHLYVSEDEPKKHSPGRFPYKNEGIWTQEDEYSISLNDLGVIGGDTLYIAAHADTNLIVGYEEPALDLDIEIPDTVTMTSTRPGGSYWVTTVTDGGILNGTYPGWCVDTDRTMAPGSSYTAEVYSSYDFAAGGFVEHPENLDQVNWVINQDFVGQPSPTCSGSYTMGDVQRSIWTLVEDNLSTSGLGAWSQCRVDEILAGAAAGGEAYEPGCFEQMAVMLVPINANDAQNAQVIISQVTVIEIDLECTPIVGGEETAWADGDYDFRRSWATYFDYEVGSQTCE
jgi:hypothetical protein